jgi:hypothetical protein
MYMMESNTHVHEYLKGAAYPIEKEDILYTAIENDAPEEVLQVLEVIPEGEYSSVGDIVRQMSNVEIASDW